MGEGVDKLMIEVRRVDSKLEALRANVESNESVASNVIAELKELRGKIAAMRGMDEAMKLSEEVKKELVAIKSVNATVERHADKIETIYAELQKWLKDFERFHDMTQDLDKSFKQIVSEFDAVQVKIGQLADKKELESLLAKFNDFENNAGNVLELVNKRVEQVEKDYAKKFSAKFEKSDKLLKGFESLAKKYPDLDRYFGLLDQQAAKQEVKVEKIEDSKK